MTKIRISARFVPSADQTIGKACFIDVELAGSVLTVQIEGFDIEVSFPSYISGTHPTASGFGGFRGPEDNPTSLLLSEFEAATVVDQAKDSAQSPELFERAAVALREAASRIADGIRTVFPWSGFPGDTPTALRWSAEEIGTGRQVPFSGPSAPEGNPQSAMIISDASFGVEDAGACLERGVSPGDYLSSHAYYFAFRSPQTRPAIAVLLSAVALESKAKEVLLKNVNPEASELLELVLKRPRILQDPAADLLNHVSQAVLGRSLKADDQELWKQVDRLFQIRNVVAHGGSAPSVADAKALSWASRRAIHWLVTGSTNPP